MNTLYAYAKRYWLLLTMLGAGAGTGVIGLVVVHVHSSSPSKDVEQQKRIDQLEKALADALAEIQKKAADKGQLSPQDCEQLKKLSEQARNLKRLQCTKKDGTAATGIVGSGSFGDDVVSNDGDDQSPVTGDHGTSSETTGAGQPKKQKVTPIDPAKQIEMMQVLLNEIEASREHDADKDDDKKDANTPKPHNESTQKKEATNDAAIKKDDGSRTTLLTNTDEASHEATVAEKIEKAVDQKITQPAIKKSKTMCNDEVSENVRRIVGDTIRRIM